MIKLIEKDIEGIAIVCIGESSEWIEQILTFGEYGGFSRKKYAMDTARVRIEDMKEELQNVEIVTRTVTVKIRMMPAREA